MISAPYFRRHGGSVFASQRRLKSRRNARSPFKALPHRMAAKRQALRKF
jgi:hypothetical protein